MNIKLLILSALAMPAAGQIPTTPMQCGGVRILQEARDYLRPNSFAIEDRGFCSKYVRVGIEETLPLHLGEGAEEFWYEIFSAAHLWNSAVNARTYPLIKVEKDRRPRSFSVPSSVWRINGPIPSAARRNAQDGQSVIYINTSGARGLCSGYVVSRPSSYGNRLEEADVYINAPGLSKDDRIVVANQHLVFFDPDSQEPSFVYSIIDDLYAVIAHELGHVVGLKHIPLRGNLMSLVPETAVSFETLVSKAYAEIVTGAPNPSNLNSLVFRDSAIQNAAWLFGMYLNIAQASQAREAFFMSRAALKPGSQDLVALMCAYEAD